jgi:ElaA protein
MLGPGDPMTASWHDRAFEELAAGELYAIVMLRERVFVVEQNCVYLDADGLDRVARHLWVENAAREIQAYLRIVPAGAKYPEVSIGRVVTAPEARGAGLARELMQRALVRTGASPVRVQAQAYLEKFYAELGFVRVTDVYDDEGIPHVEMVRTP